MAVNNTLSTFEYYVAEHTDNGIARIPERVAQDAVLQLERAGRQKASYDALLEVAKRCLAMVDEGASPPDWDWIRSIISKATS